ncbi:MAG: autotransporter domain-containing protein [Pseudomonadota bacterium]
MADAKICLMDTDRPLRSAVRHALTVLLATTALGVVSAHAVDGTWLGNSATPTEWIDPANWTSNPDLPDGTATFTNNGASATVDVNGLVIIGAASFTGAAPAYAININDVFAFNGTGVTNNSAATQTFNVGSTLLLQNSSSASAGAGPVTYNNNGSISFQSTSTAGNATFTNNGSLEFNNTSTAATATISNNATVNFQDASSAGSAGITNNASGFIAFNTTSTAGSATITNDGQVDFFNASSGGTAGAHLTNNAGGFWNFNNTSTAGAAIVVNNGDLSFNDTAVAGTSNLTNNSALSFNNGASADHALISNLGGVINFNNTSTAGNANITSTLGSVSFLDQSTAANATILNNGPSSTFFTGNSSAGSANITNIDTVTFGAATVFFGAATAANSTITNNQGGRTVFGNANGTDTATAGNANIVNNAGGFTQFLAATTAGSATIGNLGMVMFGSSGGTDTATAGNATIANGGVLIFQAATTAGNATITTGNGASVLFGDSSTGGNARFITDGGGTFDMSGLTAAGMTAGSIEGAGSYVLGNRSLAVGSNNLSTTVIGVISGVGGSLTKIGTGTMRLVDINTYTGATNVNAGTLLVDGSIAASALTTVNAGGTLAGNGIVGNTAIVGGTLGPGSTIGSAFGPLTVQGTLSFTAASTYMIQVSPTNAGLTNVTGTATLGGATVNATFLPGSYVDRQYVILNATGGVNGTFNPAVVSNMANIRSTLSYDANNAYLNIALSFAPPPGTVLNGNQQNVANALTGFFERTGSIPAAFAALNAQGLTVASGELGTGIIQSATMADNQFLNLLLDPSVAGRNGGFVPGGATPSFADEEAQAFAAKRRATPSERDAFAMAKKAPSLLAAQPANRWSVWGAAYGGSATTDGNANVGSQDTTARVYGLMAGADYKVAPNTLLGFALGGGGTNYSLASAMGRGSSDLFQAGAFGRHNFGPAYISAALAYGWHDVTTNRTVALAGVDQLQGRFKAETFSARFEGGYRFATPFIGITPYAAAQAISFHLPGYAEQSLVGNGQFALNYTSQTTTATRTELGLRADKSIAMRDAVLTLRGRAAWAHDYNPDRTVTAVFQALPGASFVVNGARGNPDAALVSAGAEMKWLSGFSLMGTFEGEFSGNLTSYAGKGVARYTW